MPDPATSIPLILMTALSAAASLLALRRLRAGREAEGDTGPSPAQHAAVVLIALGCSAVLLVRWLITRNSWNPLEAHVDGLVLMCAFFAGAVLFIQTRPKLRGLAAFALPLLTVLLLWAICASLWTFRPFRQDSLEPVWLVFHTMSTYLGLLSCAIGAIAGAMYLYVQRRLKSKQAAPGRLASLETLEALIIRAATLGFLLLSLSLVSGVVLVMRDRTGTALGVDWWLSPKVLLATLVWAVYALLMNVRYATAFRGRRAAWLAISGLVLLLATYGAVEVIEKRAADPASGPAAVLRLQPIDPAEGGRC